MHDQSLSDWSHSHVFLGAGHERNERRTWVVVGLTVAMMAIEIVGGMAFGSMALLADGWHMATHAGALGVTALAYRYARSNAGDPRFAFGTGKLGDLAGFTSAVVLALIALVIGYESVLRLFDPVIIHFDEAIPIAVVGLVVNLSSAWLLGSDHHHHGDHEHSGDHHDRHHLAESQDHRDHNIRSAYWHVMADALTSVLAIVGLVAARSWGWSWLDPVMGIVGAVLIAHWSWGLVRGAGAVLLDTAADGRLTDAIRNTLESGDDRIADLHVWRLGPGHHGAIVSIVSDEPIPVADYKRRLIAIPGLSHITVEVHPCPGGH
jgi:cation diffusion facilitator family transporter